MRLHDNDSLMLGKAVRRTLLLSTCLLCLAGPVAADNLLVDAQRYFDKGEYRSAVIQLKNALNDNPDDAQARLLLGKTYLMLEDGPSAAKELQLAREKGVAREQWLIPLGRAYLLSGSGKELLKEIVATAQDGKSLTADVLAMHGQAYLMAGQPKVAVTQFKKALDLVPNHTGALLGQIRLAIEQQDYTGAARLIGLARHSPNPDVPATDILEGELLRITGKPKEAIELFRKALVRRPGNVAAQLGLAASYLATKDYAAADKILAEVHGRWPGMPLGNYLIALSRYQQQQYDQSEESLQQVFVMEPDHAPSRLLHGTLNYLRGNYTEAEKSLRRYMKAVPSHVPAIKLLSATLLKLNQPWDAVDVLQKGQRYAPNDAQYQALLGSAYLRNGESDKAMTSLEQASQAVPDMAEVRAQIAIGHLLQGDSEQTAAALQSAVTIDKDLVEADILRVLLHIKNKAYDKAQLAAQALIDKRPDQPMGYNLLGAVQLGREDAAGARKAFERALKVQETFIPALLNLARLNVLEGKAFEANKGLKHILTLEPDNISALSLLARMATKAGDNEEAVKWLEKARSSNPGAIEPSLLLVDHYLRTNNVLKALDVARQLQLTHPKTPAVLAALGLAQMQANIDSSAETTLRKLVELTPKNVQSHLLLARILSKRQNLGEARQSLQTVLELQPDNIDARLELGTLELGLQRGDEALRVAKDIQARFSNRAEGYEMEGDALHLLKQPDKAASAYGQAYRLQATAQRAVKHSEMLLAAGQTSQANAPLLDWLKKQPDDTPLRVLLASQLQQQGDANGAIAQYEQVIVRDSENLVALNNLAWLYQQAGDSKALETAEKAYELAPDRAEIIDTYAWMLVNGGDPERALTLLKEAVMRAPHISEIRYHMAVAMQRNGEADGACRELGMLLDTDKEFESFKDAQSLAKKVCPQ